MDKEF